MSWQAYVEGPSSLVGQGKLKAAAIIDVAGDSNWACTTGFNLQPDEAKNLANYISSGKDDLYGTGFYAGTKKFKCILMEPGVIIGKEGKEGIIIMKAEKCIFIGYHPAEVDTRDGRSAVQGVVDYLRGLGY
ncbi:profilin, required for normal timing of actin polymerization in response to thermal stress [Orbilia ellipsospora]|uniref:Profilin n=1 Tax=Orbilia ellipsospora TaxID=2528407 RepID=A0AAV9XMV7_9PEZI